MEDETARAMFLELGRSLIVLLLVAAAGFVYATDYEIEVELDPETHRLHGLERIRWINVSGVEAEALYLHLYLNAFSNSESTFMRGLARSNPAIVPRSGWGWIRIDRLRLEEDPDLFSRLEFVRPDDGNEADFTLARLPLAVPVRPGGVVELELEFVVQLPRIVARSGYAGDFHFVAQWFPKLSVFAGERGWNAHQYHATSEFHADFGSYRVAMTVPDDWLLAASGFERARRVDDGKQTFVYDAAPVQDFAWCAAPAALMRVVEADFNPGRDVPVSWFEETVDLLDRSPADLELPPMKLRLLVPVEQLDLAPRMISAARLSLAWFGLRYGAYPYPQLTIVSPPAGAEWAGGMEYPTLVTTGAGRLDGWPPFSWFSSIEAITAHEIGHQYFQGLVASNEFEQPWLDEGLTSYGETACVDDMRKAGFLAQPLSGSVWRTARVATAASLLPVTPDRAAWLHPSRWSYFVAVNFKPSLAFKTLEGLIGAPAMARGLRDYVERYRFQRVMGGDLVEVLSDAAGRDLRWFFDQAIASDAEPDWGVLAVHQRPRERARGWRWQGGLWLVDDEDGPAPQTWSVEVQLVRRGELVGPVEVELEWSDGTVERRVWAGRERWVSWSLEREDSLRRVTVDPDGVWVLETQRADNYWRDQPRRPESPLWWLRLLLPIIGASVLGLG
jgi:hypothetical protein